MDKTAVVIIPTTGAYTLHNAVQSVLKQDYKTKALVVVDGAQYDKQAWSILKDYSSDTSRVEIVFLNSNVGGGGFYGHRIYAAFTHLVNEDYVLYLDQDNWLEPNHVSSLINTIEQEGLQWAYSLRYIADNDGTFLFPDNCESLGMWPEFTGNYNHVDTSCYCIKREVAVQVASVWHGSWGQDRVFYRVLGQHFPQYKCSGKHTLNYRLGGNEGSVKASFFTEGNTIMQQKYTTGFPWVK